jgi:hypothetical protein
MARWLCHLQVQLTAGAMRRAQWFSHTHACSSPIISSDTCLQRGRPSPPHFDLFAAYFEASLQIRGKVYQLHWCCLLNGPRTLRSGPSLMIPMLTMAVAFMARAVGCEQAVGAVRRNASRLAAFWSGSQTVASRRRPNWDHVEVG